MKEQERRVAVVIVNYNGEEFIAQCLTSLRNQTFNEIEVTVLDNGSADRSAEVVERDFPEVRLIRSGENLGFAGGNNAVIAPILESGESDFVFTLNNDVVLEEDCIEKMVSAMDAAPPEVWSCQPKMYLNDTFGGAQVFNNTGIQVWYDGSAFNRGINRPDRGQYDGDTEIFGTCAGASLYRVSGLREVGLFDGDFFCYLEDVDLAWRGRRAGFRSVLVPGAVCFHRHGAAGGDPAAKIRIVERNRMWVLVKEYPALLVLASPLFTVYRLARIAMASFVGSRGGARLEAYRSDLTAAAAARALAAGLLQGLAGLPACIRKRRAFATRSILRNRELVRLVSKFSRPLGESIET